MITTTVTQKGQVTIPVSLRQALAIKPKDRVVFRLSRQGIIINKATSPVETLFGAAAGKKVRFVSLKHVRRQAGQKLGEKYQRKNV